MTVLDTQTQPDTRPCQGPGCEVHFARRYNESRPDFAQRRYCSPQCSGAARRKPVVAPKPRRGMQTAAPEPELRITDAGVWRPNAPGWPDEPGARA